MRYCRSYKGEVLSVSFFVYELATNEKAGLMKAGLRRFAASREHIYAGRADGRWDLCYSGYPDVDLVGPSSGYAF